MSQTVEFENSPHVVRLNLRDPTAITPNLLPAVYKIKLHPKLGILLPKVKERYALPKTVFGTKTSRAADLIMTAFKRRDGIMGALVTGIKGSGKTLLTETVSNIAIDMGMPVLIVDDPDLELDTLELIVKHCEPCVVQFDEFAKVFRDEKQENLLTFFSSTGYNKVLCLMAENEVKSVNTYLLNRPGRMLFHLRYENVTVEEAAEVTKAMGVLPEIAEEIRKYVEVAQVSMDVLRTICDSATYCKDVAEFKELFDVLNIPKMEFFEYALNVDGDSQVQLDLQRRYEYSATLVSAGTIKLVRTEKATGEEFVELIQPAKDRYLKLKGWTAMQVESSRTTRPPEMDSPIPINWKVSLKDHEEAEAKWEEKSADPKSMLVKEGTGPF